MGTKLAKISKRVNNWKSGNDNIWKWDNSKFSVVSEDFKRYKIIKI